jgi:hypothetical protein
LTAKIFLKSFLFVTKNSCICKSKKILTKKDKLIDRFLATPKDFTFDELVRLFNHFRFETETKAKLREAE